MEMLVVGLVGPLGAWAAINPGRCIARGQALRMTGRPVGESRAVMGEWPGREFGLGRRALLSTNSRDTAIDGSRVASMSERR